MKRTKPRNFSSAREVFNAYLPKSTQEREVNSGYGQVEDQRTKELLEDFRSSLERQTRRQTS